MNIEIVKIRTLCDKTNTFFNFNIVNTEYLTSAHQHSRQEKETILTINNSTSK
ncbi:MAG: hypothetical protein LBQ04_00550 [Endomicrobium sp.]|nr:hypothetical protein [Endomicrobium sp.]